VPIEKHSSLAHFFLPFARLESLDLACPSATLDSFVCSARYSEMMRSAHSTRETKMAGFPNFAFQFARSFSETPRAREQAPQAKTGMCLATTFSRNSLRGGQPMGITASEVALRIR